MCCCIRRGTCKQSREQHNVSLLPTITENWCKACTSNWRKDVTRGWIILWELPLSISTDTECPKIETAKRRVRGEELPIIASEDNWKCSDCSGSAFSRHGCGLAVSNNEEGNGGSWSSLLISEVSTNLSGGSSCRMSKNWGSYSDDPDETVRHNCSIDSSNVVVAFLQGIDAE